MRKVFFLLILFLLHWGKVQGQQIIPLKPSEIYVAEAIRIVPDIILDFTDKLLIVQPDGSVSTQIQVHAHREILNSVLIIYANNRKLKEIVGPDLETGQDRVLRIKITAAELLKISKENITLRLSLVAGSRRDIQAQHLVQYGQLPALQYFTTPSAKVIRPNWINKARKIGYVPGTDDFLPAFLKQAGLTVDILGDADLKGAGSIQQYDAIITGVRAANIEKRMTQWLPVLDDYVRLGGTLIMQYNTPEDLPPAPLGPYSFALSHNRVTGDNVQVSFINPEHRLLQYPNKITRADFDGWVGDRAIYIPSKWDNHNYQPLFVMYDSDLKPLEGTTLYAGYWKGHYIYTTLTFFRQLPAGNKGAIRLFMNMLSVGK